jgi:hypothetical protein
MEDTSNFVDVDLQEPRTDNFHNEDNEFLMAEIQRIVTSADKVADNISSSLHPGTLCGSAHSVRSSSSMSSIEEASGDEHYQIHTDKLLAVGDRTPRYDWLSQEPIPTVEVSTTERQEASSEAEPPSPTFFWGFIARLFAKNEAGVSY